MGSGCRHQLSSVRLLEVEKRRRPMSVKAGLGAFVGLGALSVLVVVLGGCGGGDEREVAFTGADARRLAQIAPVTPGWPAWPARPERNNPWWMRVSHVESGPSQSGGRVTAPKLVMPDQSWIRGSAQTGTSWRQRTSGPSALASSTIFRRKPLRRGGWAFPWKTFHVRTRSGTGRGYSSKGYGRPMHVVLADPPAFTTP